MKKLLYFPFMLIMSLFDNTNVTTDSGMSVEMKTYYDKFLIRNAEPELVHDRWAQKKPIPQGKGKTVEFRKYSPFPKALTPLVEGVTPSGRKLEASAIYATVAQYGDYVEYSDILKLTTIDNNIQEALILLSPQAGRTLDTITREVLNGGSNVIYGEGQVNARHLLVGGETSGNHYLTVRSVRKAARFLKVMNAPRIDKCFMAIVHPDTTFDIQDDPDWRKPHEYKDTTNIYDDEIGKIAGVRFVETTEAKIFKAPDLAPATATTDTAARDLTVKTATTGSASATLTIKEALSAAQASALEDRDVIIGGNLYTIVSAASGAAGSATITIDEAIEVAADVVIYPGEAGAKGRDVYSTIFLGAEAYGVTELQDGGLETIIKPLGSAGAADPLNQRGTIGWKATKAAIRLVEAYMVRVETASSFDDAPAN